MNIDLELIELFKEFYEKQDIVQKQSTKPYIHEYGHSELHCLEAIGRWENPNVSLVALKLAITRGAASKIVKKLLNRGDIDSYQLPTNKKEIYYRLTERGRKAAEAHERRHRLWQERDLGFLKSIASEDKAVILRFLRNFNKYLLERIEEQKSGR